MSADNGIYILETEGPEYRVEYLCAIDNLDYDTEKGEVTENMSIVMKNARSMWHNSPVFTDRVQALLYAEQMSERCDYLEYGIRKIKLNAKF